MSRVLNPPPQVRLELSLGELEGLGPCGSGGNGQRRFCCPLPACSEKPLNRAHASLVVNIRTGAWICHRCGGRGRLLEWRPESQAVERRARRTWRKVLSAAEAQPNRAWRTTWNQAIPLTGTPGSSYLESRGIRAALGAGAGVRFESRWYGRPAVLFPLVDPLGDQVAVESRYIDGGSPKVRSAGPKGQGLFVVPGAWDGAHIVLVEAPIDALSLLMVGLRAVALCGVHVPSWLPERLAWRTVWVAFDADPRGTEAAADLVKTFHILGISARRFQPQDTKDWNELLVRDPVQLAQSVADLWKASRVTSEALGGKGRPIPVVRRRSGMPLSPATGGEHA